MDGWTDSEGQAVKGEPSSQQVVTEVLSSQLALLVGFCKSATHEANHRRSTAQDILYVEHTDKIAPDH